MINRCRNTMRNRSDEKSIKTPKEIYIPPRKVKKIINKLD